VVEVLSGGDLLRLDLVSTTGCRHVGSLGAPSFQQVRQFAVSPDGGLLAALSGRSVIVWDMKAVESPPIKVTSPGRLAFTGTAFHPSGKYLAVTSNDATVYLYDTRTWSVLQTFAWEIGRLRCVAFSADGCLAAAGNDRGQIVVWDVDL
jgi:WD40 repeat protein